MIEFQESAKRDDVRALNYLGIMYAEGMGTPRDDAKAVAMFSKAALLGFPEAMANMGRMHAEGRGVPQDNKAAVAAYSAAARSGFQPAITRMAMIYEKGELGVEPDAVQARAWRARLSAPPRQSAPAAAGAIDAVAATPPAEPVETPDMVALARAARTQLQVPQAQPVDAAPPRAAAPVPEAIAPAAVTPQPVQAAEPRAPSLPASPPPVAAPAPATIPAATPPEPIRKPQTQAVDAVPTQAPPQNVIESIAVTLQSGAILIRVRTRTPLAVPPTDFMVATPPRIVFDFPHTVTGLGRYHEVGESDLQSVDVISGDSRTRMVLILRNSMQHDAKMDGGDLLIRLVPIPAPATSGSAGNPPRRSSR